MQAASQSPDIFNKPEEIKTMANIIKTNVSACSSIGSAFIVQIARIYNDLLNVYRATSQLISQAVTDGGTFSLPLLQTSSFVLGLVQTKTPRVRGLRTIKREILKMIQTYVLKTEELQVVLENLVPPLLDVVLGDYNRNVEPARDSEVLSLMAAIVQKLGV